MNRFNFEKNLPHQTEAVENTISVFKNLISKLEKKWYKCYCGTLDNTDNITETFDYILMSQVIEHTYDPIYRLFRIYRMKCREY